MGGATGSAGTIRQKTDLAQERIVRPSGVEPETFGSGGQHSIQLSYGRVSKTAVEPVPSDNQTTKNAPESQAAQGPSRRNRTLTSATSESDSGTSSSNFRYEATASPNCPDSSAERPREFPATQPQLSAKEKRLSMNRVRNSRPAETGIGSVGFTLA